MHIDKPVAPPSPVKPDQMPKLLYKLSATILFMLAMAALCAGADVDDMLAGGVIALLLVLPMACLLQAAGVKFQ